MASTTAQQQQLPPGVITQVSTRTGRLYHFNTFTGESWYPDEGKGPSGNSASAAQPSNGAAEAAGGAMVGPPPAKRQKLEDGSSSLDSAVHPKDQAVSLAVAAAYDAHTDRGIHGRKESSILHLKNFNNWVKAVLISEYAPSSPASSASSSSSSSAYGQGYSSSTSSSSSDIGATSCSRVLDLACGKCGDIQKWRLAGVERYCGVDISLTGVKDGARRFNGINARNDNFKRPPMEAKLIRADLGVTNLKASGVVGANEQFDVISIQFALHYLFQSEARALAFFRNIADCLAIGGVFLGTIPDASYLVRRIRDTAMAAAAAESEVKREGSDAASSSASTSAASSRPSATRFGNSIYYVDFDPDTVERQWQIGNNPWGLGYTFYLAESVESVKEYLVPWQLLERLAASCGLIPLANDNFHSFYRRMTGSSSTQMMTTVTTTASTSEGAAGSKAVGPVPPPVTRTTVLPPSPNAAQHIQTLRSMKVMDCEGTMSKEEWEAAGIYRVFAFKRVRTEAESLALGLTRLPPASALFPRGLKKIDGSVVPVQSLPDGSTRGGIGVSYNRALDEENDIVDMFAAVPTRKLPKSDLDLLEEAAADEGEEEFA